MLPNRGDISSRPRKPSRAEGGRMELKYANVTYFIQESQLKGRFHPSYQSSYWAKEGREALRRLGLPIRRIRKEFPHVAALTTQESQNGKTRWFM
ncbi:hypothetical protein CDAR_177361 [Caerostris darwini]|uniref:Uncharacterized protein n=1 Tax=Caerostris darwini TaxID=1538125 RepID=A0AAV4P4L7_9ARAC|nr:hypothetical protein CDAR_177361 [Caerostris darwini]